MIPRIQKILYATDLSQNSAYAFRYAINSAVKYDAELIILHVLEQMSSTNQALANMYLGEEQTQKLVDERTNYAIDRIRKRLKTFCERELKDEPEIAGRVKSVKVCEGFPAEVILRTANELDCDAIVMGAHGKDRISYTFFGSTAKRVLRRTRKPVFIIPLPHGEIDISFHDE
jgi:nucleotide-binding universal stress UspA family protein